MEIWNKSLVDVFSQHSVYESSCPAWHLIGQIWETFLMSTFSTDWLIEQCFTSPPTQYRLYGRRFLQVKRPNQQYQNTEGESEKENNTKNIKKTENTHTHTHTHTHTKYTNNRYTNKHSKSPSLQ